MTHAPSDPTTTHRLFEHERVAAGYASARPYLHAEVFARVRDLIRADWPLHRALDFGDAGRSPEMPGLERWHEEVFRLKFPRPPSRDPIITGEEAKRFGLTGPENEAFESRCSFTATRYADFLMTESNVIAVVEYGKGTAEQVRIWLEAELTPLFGGGSRAVSFEGYIQLLRKL